MTAKISAQITDIVKVDYSNRFVRAEFDKPTRWNNSFYTRIIRGARPTRPFYDPNGYIFSDVHNVDAMKNGGRYNEQNDDLSQQFKATVTPIKNWNIIGEFNVRTTNNWTHWDEQITYAHYANNPEATYVSLTSQVSQNQVYEQSYRSTFMSPNIYSSYNFSDGLPSPIFTNGTAYKDPKGVLWFGNTKGLIYLHPARLKDVRRHPYKIVLTDVLVNGSPIDSLTRKDYAQTGELSFAHNQNNVTFRFVNLSYTDPATMVYEYKMEGNDEEWHLLNGNNEVSYYDLPPGNYTFLVRIPGDESSTVSVSVNIALMYSLWFWLFIVTCVAFAGVIVYHYRKEKSYLPKISISLEEQTNILGEEKLHEEKYKTNRLTDEECNLLHQKVRTYMEEKRPFVNPDLKIADLAKAVDTSSYSLSFLFNQFLNQSYYDFVNEYRIAEFKKMANDARYAKYTLTALAELCGFSSRASFFRTFKKSTGITPNEYIRTIGAFNQ
ncbi:hypothetical protein SDC9_67312 [bioreactor metagenome]|uniref:HTH araC/xylS-type domain-containing protein n=1 Tax=bioreactor metagenome TaxID=1076179 RepID=A0A644Y403_9ZZZZ